MGRIGRDANGGVSRPSFSKADLEARAWLKEKVEDAGLAYRVDGAGNIFGRLESVAGGRTVMAGSHIDTVLHGGMFDGAVGVLAALECLQTIREKACAFRNRCPWPPSRTRKGTSSAISSAAGRSSARSTGSSSNKGRPSFGVPLRDVLRNTDFTIESILTAHESAPEIEAFLELHIEQGPTLETKDVPVGMVDIIPGKHYRWCSFVGEAGHAGTVAARAPPRRFPRPRRFRPPEHAARRHAPLRQLRHDRQGPRRSRAPLPSFPAGPTSPSNSGAGPKTTLAALEKELFALAEDIASTRGLAFLSKVMDKTDPVAVPERLLGLLKAECETLGYPSLVLPSGAGHDAQILAAKTDAAMIFIPSPDGVSHAPQESIRWDDLEKGANVLLSALMKLAS